jgi:broad specificity phosphatase PhoE
VIDNRLVLQSFGSFEGMPYHTFTSYFSNPQDIYTAAVPGGELGVDVFNRIHSFLWDVANQNVNSTVVIITHGFNCNQINMCLTGEYGKLLTSGNFNLYDFY